MALLEYLLGPIAFLDDEPEECEVFAVSVLPFLLFSCVAAKGRRLGKSLSLDAGDKNFVSTVFASVTRMNSRTILEFDLDDGAPHIATKVCKSFNECFGVFLIRVRGLESDGKRGV